MKPRGVILDLVEHTQNVVWNLINFDKPNIKFIFYKDFLEKLS